MKKESDDPWWNDNSDSLIECGRSSYYLNESDGPVSSERRNHASGYCVERSYAPMEIDDLELVAFEFIPGTLGHDGWEEFSVPSAKVKDSNGGDTMFEPVIKSMSEETSTP